MCIEVEENLSEILNEGSTTLKGEPDVMEGMVEGSKASGSGEGSQGELLSQGELHIEGEQISHGE